MLHSFTVVPGRAAAFAVPLVFLLAPLASAQDVPGPSFEDVIALRGASNPVISPDGSEIVFSVGTVDWAENRFDSELWLAREGEPPFPLTRTSDGSSYGARWSPDGRWLAFLADRGDKTQVYVMRSGGGEAHAATDADEGVGSFRWSPDGTQIAYTSTEPQDERMEKREEKFGAFSVEDAEYRMTHLWVVDFEPDPWPSPAEAPCADKVDSLATDCARPPEPRRLTEGDTFTVNDFEWSPDGSRIAIEHRPDSDILSFQRADIAVIDVASGDRTPLVARPGFDGGLVWSPDGAWVLFSTSAGDTTSNFYRNTQLHRVPAEGGEPERLAAAFDENISVVDWTERGIFFTAWQKTARPLFLLDPGSGRRLQLTDSLRNVWGVDLSADGGTLALSGQTPETLSEIYRTRFDAIDPQPVTDMTAQIEGWDVGTTEVVSWESRDGAEIEGVLFKPAEFDPNEKYPLLVVIHGGPTGIDYPTPIDGYVYPIPQWLAKGAVVLQPNYRGSAGYGEAFRSLNVRNLGVGDAWDVLSGVDYLIEQGFVDEDRMGAMGWSQGGYISAYLTTTTDRFAAISVGAGISNWVTYYVNTDIHPFTRQYLQATPWEDPEVYLKTSPMTTITGASTPTLIQHGEFDRRVPIPNAYELYQGLQDVGVETRLIVYKGFGHGITKPKERLAALWHNWQWFGRHLWNEEIELPLDGDEAEETDDANGTKEDG